MTLHKHTFLDVALIALKTRLFGHSLFEHKKEVMKTSIEKCAADANPGFDLLY